MSNSISAADDEHTIPTTNEPAESTHPFTDADYILRGGNQPIDTNTNSNTKKSKSEEDPTVPFSESELARRAIIANSSSQPGLRQYVMAQRDNPKGSLVATDIEMHYLDQAFKYASIDALPSARIVMFHSPGVGEEHQSRFSTSIRLQGTFDEKYLIGTIQRTGDVDFSFHIPYTDKSTTGGPASKEAIKMLSCSIVYNPPDDTCVLYNLGETLYISILGSSQWQKVIRYAVFVVAPGMWRIAVANGTNDDKPANHLADFLILERKFHVSIHRASNTVTQKRQRSDIDAGIASHDPKRRAMIVQQTTEVIIQPIAQLVVPQQAKPAEISSDTPNLERSIVQNKGTPLIDLHDGETAIVKTVEFHQQQQVRMRSNETLGQSPDTYQLERVRFVGETKSTSVFACRHSALASDNVVAKVLRYEGASAKSLVSFAHSLKREVSILKKLSHPNVVSMEAFDGRLFALYLEYVPGSLYQGRIAEFSREESLSILQGCASALAYLNSKNIYHNDIKPRNVTFTPQRGPVIIDFGTASVGEEELMGGTPWYLPPEMAHEGQRGAPGDVFALGITMLYVLGKIQIAERIGDQWNMFKIRTDPEAFNKMKQWMTQVEGFRGALDSTVSTESLVYMMLEPARESRITAKEIENRLKGE